METFRAVLLLEEDGPPLIHPTVMMRIDALRELGGYRHYPCAEDRDLWIRASRSFAMMQLNDVLLKYRVNPSGASRSNEIVQLIYRLAAITNELIFQSSGIDLYSERQSDWHDMVKQIERFITPELTCRYSALNRVRAKLRGGQWAGTFAHAIPLFWIIARSRGWPSLRVEQRTICERVASAFLRQSHRAY
jgi:hypothetical protein